MIRPIAFGTDPQFRPSVRQSLSLDYDAAMFTDQSVHMGTNAQIRPQNNCLFGRIWLWMLTCQCTWARPTGYGGAMITDMSVYIGTHARIRDKFLF